MRWSDLRHGKELTFRVRPQPPHERAPSGPVRPWTRKVDGTLVLEHAGDSLPVVPVDATALRAASQLTDVPDRVLAHVRDGGGGTWLVQGRLFTGRLVLPSPLHILVPPDVAEDIPEHWRRDLQAWLLHEFQVDGVWLAQTGGAELRPDRAFTLLGHHKSLRIVPGPEGMVARRIIRAHPRADARLIEGEFRLETATEARVRAASDKLDEGSGTDTDDPLAERFAGSAFFAQWERYRQAERELVLREAEELGALPYRSWTLAPDGSLDFLLTHPLPRSWRETRARFSLDAENKDPASATGRGPASLGSVVGATRDGRHLRVERGARLDEPPPSGQLRVNTQGDEQRIQRQQRALEKMADGQCHMPDLLDVLEGRGRQHRTDGRLDVMSPGVQKLLGDRKLTLAQKRAVDVALNTPDIAIIQGPPGTGKTTVIQVIAQRLHEERRSPVLLTSYQHEAVLRVIDGMTVGGLPVVRVGGRRGESNIDSLATLEDWLRTVVRHVDDAIETRIPEDPWHALREQTWHTIGQWRAHPGSRAQAATLLRDLKRRVGHRLTPALLTRIDELEQELTTVAPPREALRDDAARERVLALLHSQRVEDVGWSDDGPESAKRLSRALKSADAPAELRHVMQRAADRRHADGPPADFEDELARIRAWATPNATPERETDGLPPALDVLLNDCLAHLEQRAARAGEGLADALQRFRDRVLRDPDMTRKVLSTYARALGATVQQAVGKQMRSLHAEFDTVIVDEAARANPLDLLIPLTLARRIILVGDQAQLPHMLEPRLEKALDDGASERASEILRESLFARLWSLYHLTPPGGIRRTVMLDRQFRMHPTLGDLVSRTFYDGTLENGVDADDRPPIDGTSLRGPVAWFDLPARAGRESRKGSSKARPVEVDRTMQILGGILQAEPDASVGVISFYAGQVQALEDEVQRRGWEDRVRVGTVDAFQGREFDAVLLSTVRSGHGVGFLALPNRLNVAISRGKRFVGVVGDRATVRAVPALDAFARCCEQEGTYVADL